MLVDDSAPVRERLRALLGEAGIADVSEANSVERARRLMEGSNFEAAIVDVHLGAASGLALIEIVRAQQPLCYVIVLTNDATECHRRACEQRGAHLFLDKSRQFQEAAETLRRHSERGALPPSA